MTSCRRTTTMWLVGLVMAAALLGACTSPREALGTNASPCFQALPVAAAAVHHRGVLQGVRLIDAQRLGRHDQLRAVASMRAGHPVRSVCAFAYRGAYSLGQVERPLGHQPPGNSAPYAVVLVATPQNTLLATFVLEHEPFRFRHDVL